MKAQHLFSTKHLCNPSFQSMYLKNMKSPPSPSAHQPSSIPALLLMRLPSLLIKPRASWRSLTRFDKISTFVLDSCRPTCDGNKFQVHPSCHPTARKMGIYEMTQHATAYQIMVLLKIATHWCVYIYNVIYIYIIIYIYIHIYIYIYAYITMRQLKINEISSVLSWWSAQLTCRRRPGTFNCTFMVAMSFRAWSRSFRVKYDEACDRDHQNGSEFTHTSPYFSGEIDISMLKLIVSQVYPIIPTFIKAHQN